MSRYANLIRKLPPDMQLVMLELIESFEEDMRAKLAVRREDFDDLQAAVRELAQAQIRTEKRVEELAQAQARTEKRLDALTQRVEELAQAQARTEKRVDALTVQVQELVRTVTQLVEMQQRADERIERLTKRQDSMIGFLLEQKYRERAYGYFGSILRKVKVESLQDIEPQLEQVLSPTELWDLALIDVLVSGRLRNRPDVIKPVWLAMEVSSVIDRSDVERAQHRAALLRRGGYVVVPAVAGEEITLGAQRLVKQQPVFVMQNGHKSYWEEALASALAAAEQDEED